MAIENKNQNPKNLLWEHEKHYPIAFLSGHKNSWVTKFQKGKVGS